MAAMPALRRKERYLIGKKVLPSFILKMKKGKDLPVSEGSEKEGVRAISDFHLSKRQKTMKTPQLLIKRGKRLAEPLD